MLYWTYLICTCWGTVLSLRIFSLILAWSAGGAVCSEETNVINENQSAFRCTKQRGTILSTLYICSKQQAFKDDYVVDDYLQLLETPQFNLICQSATIFQKFIKLIQVATAPTHRKSVPLCHGGCAGCINVWYVVWLKWDVNYLQVQFWKTKTWLHLKPTSGTQF